MDGAVANVTHGGSLLRRALLCGQRRTRCAGARVGGWRFGSCFGRRRGLSHGSGLRRRRRSLERNFRGWGLRAATASASRQKQGRNREQSERLRHHGRSFAPNRVAHKGFRQRQSATTTPPRHYRHARSALECSMALHVGIVACSAEGAALCYRTLCAEGAPRQYRASGAAAHRSGRRCPGCTSPRRVGLTGTQWLVESSVYPDKLAAHASSANSGRRAAMRWCSAAPRSRYSSTTRIRLCRRSTRRACWPALHCDAQWAKGLGKSAAESSWIRKSLGIPAS